MKIISKQKVHRAIGSMIEVQQMIISYINTDTNIEEQDKARLVKKVETIAKNVVDVLTFGKFPFKFLNSQQRTYIHECMICYADLSDYYCRKPPKVSEMSKSLEFLSLSFNNIGDMMEIADGFAGYSYLRIRRKKNINDKRSLVKIEQYLLTTNYHDTALWTLAFKYNK